MGGSPSVTVRKIEDKHVIIRLMCQQCPRDFFTMQGYNNHLFMDHKIRKVDDYPPKTITNNEHSMSTSYSSGQFDAILNDEDDASKDVEGNVVLETECNLPTINPPERIITKKKSKTKKYAADQKVKCDICGERFFSDDGLRIHTTHAHDPEWQEYCRKGSQKEHPSEDERPSDESGRGRKEKEETVKKINGMTVWADGKEKMKVISHQKIRNQM